MVSAPCTEVENVLHGAAAAPFSLDNSPLTQRHVVVVLIIATGWFWDVGVVSIGSVLSTVFSDKSSTVSTGALSWVVASAFLGAIVGAATFGWAADRFGRRRTLIATLLLLAVSACGAALSPSIEWLIVCRTLSGVAIGAYPVVAVPYLAEMLPVRSRGRMHLLAAGIGAVALPATLLGARLLADSVYGDAWRWICAICATGSALTVVAMLRLPEPPKWLRSRGRAGAAELVERAFASAPLSGECVCGVPTSRESVTSRSIAPALPDSARQVKTSVLAAFVIFSTCLRSGRLPDFRS
jgi:putative MFS transporter